MRENTAKGGVVWRLGVYIIGAGAKKVLPITCGASRAEGNGSCLLLSAVSPIGPSRQEFVLAIPSSGYRLDRFGLPYISLDRNLAQERVNVTKGWSLRVKTACLRDEGRFMDRWKEGFVALCMLVSDHLTVDRRM